MLALCRGPDLARGRENAARRGLSGRVAFVEGTAADHASPADAVISCGAYQAFGTIPEALKALRLFGEAGRAAAVRRRDLGPDAD